MKHPFHAGGRYRNRTGEYEVVKLEDPQMVIRYADGHEITTTIEMQARIWHRLQEEESLGIDPRDALVQFPTATNPESRGRDFHGLQETDFTGEILGTSWRARSSLGGLLAQAMSDATGRQFEPYPIYPYPEVHIAQPEYYREPHGKGSPRAQSSRFFLLLGGWGATFGLHPSVPIMVRQLARRV